MNIIQTLKRPFIWLIRIRKRCGYGVHSPFAFDLITNVFYEKAAYYAYAELREEEKRLRFSADHSSTKVKRLLFRLVNRVQPQLLVDAGSSSAASLYLRAAKKEINYTKVDSTEKCVFKPNEQIDFLYIHRYHHPSFVEEIFNRCLPHTHEQTVFVIEGIGYSRKMRKLWKRMIKNDKVFVTFDLYDVGILFFDSQKIKQHYLVNF